MRKYIRRLKSWGEHAKAKAIAETGRAFIAIKEKIGGLLTGDWKINLADVQGSKQFYQSVKLYDGREFSEWDRLPFPETASVYLAWEKGYPLGPSRTLHERIINGAGMVSRTDYYHQDGSVAFYDIHLLRMRLFVEHLTTLDLTAWNAMVARAPKSGPGFIRAAAAFCQGTKTPEVTEEPNIGNLIAGHCKVARGEALNSDEARTYNAALGDDEMRETFFSIFKGR